MCILESGDSGLGTLSIEFIAGVSRLGGAALVYLLSANKVGREQRVSLLFSMDYNMYGLAIYNSKIQFLMRTVSQLIY